jgi:hypothetical protein
MLDFAGLKITDTVLGTGRETAKGALIQMHYEGYLDDGRKFDSSMDKGRIFQFVLGAKRVIQGMDQGLIGMREGGKRTIFIPAHLAYGERSVNGIPPNSNLKAMCIKSEVCRKLLKSRVSISAPQKRQSRAQAVPRSGLHRSLPELGALLRKHRLSGVSDLLVGMLQSLLGELRQRFGMQG